jgi:hypothetical protein
VIQINQFVFVEFIDVDVHLAFSPSYHDGRCVVL